MTSEEVEELYFLRMEKAVANGVKAGLDQHLDTHHKPIDRTLVEIREEQKATSQKMWTFGGIATGALALWQLLQSK